VILPVARDSRLLIYYLSLEDFGEITSSLIFGGGRLVLGFVIDIFIAQGHVRPSPDPLFFKLVTWRCRRRLLSISSYPR
jgi:hypothetical protein